MWSGKSPVSHTLLFLLLGLGGLFLGLWSAAGNGTVVLFALSVRLFLLYA